jgi:hypothetical protein
VYGKPERDISPRMIEHDAVLRSEVMLGLEKIKEDPVGSASLVLRKLKWSLWR